jgi:mannose-6-phosphate isomerase-like protein (cupin superfamily)
MDVVNQQDAVPFTTVDGSTIRELLAHRNSAIRQQSLAEARLKPGCATVPHHHAVTEEIYYILTGTAAMTLGQETRNVGPGDAIAIPPGVRHTICNTGSGELVFLCTCAPGYEHSDTFLEQPPTAYRPSVRGRPRQPGLANARLGDEIAGRTGQPGRSAAG